MASKKYYGVRAGRVPGVYSNWGQCKQQIDGFPNAIFKSFLTEAEAKAYVNQAAKISEVQSDEKHELAIDIFVDGSYYKNQYSWAFAVYQGGKVLFADSGVGEDEEAARMNNVAGELAATVKAIKWAEANAIKPVMIHHDYMGIAAWAEGSWQAKNKFTQAYVKFIFPRSSWIRFAKVEGHTGIAGNEFVDKLAKKALGR